MCILHLLDIHFFYLLNIFTNYSTSVLNTIRDSKYL